MQQIIINSNQAGQRFDKFLNKHLSGAGTGFIYKMLRKKNITLNGKKADGKEMLSVGDEVKLFFSEETYAKFTGKESTDFSVYQKAFQFLKEIEILYEDEDVLMLNKPAGVLSQKAADSDLSANEWLLGYLIQKGELTEEAYQSFHPSVCNRLDRNTSGILMCGKTFTGSRELNRLIKEHKVRKFYRLFVKGRLNKEGILEGYLSKNEAHNKVSLSKQSSEDNSYIKTAYKPLSLGKYMTYLEVELFTGKTHQIRAHLSGIGHPLLGDYKYGDRDFNRFYKERYHIESQLLHAVRLEFPKDCGALSKLNDKVINSPLPEEFLTILEKEKMTEWQPGIHAD